MPAYSELKMKDVTVRIFDTPWNGHSGMKLYHDKFICFLDEKQIEAYKFLQALSKVGVAK